MHHPSKLFPSKEIIDGALEMMGWVKYPPYSRLLSHLTLVDDEHLINKPTECILFVEAISTSRSMVREFNWFAYWTTATDNSGGIWSQGSGLYCHWPLYIQSSLRRFLQVECLALILGMKCRIQILALFASKSWWWIIGDWDFTLGDILRID